jgi:signal transduction histidine kinase
MTVWLSDLLLTAWWVRVLRKRPDTRTLEDLEGQARALRGELERARRELQTFASSVGHELRTPLSALSGEVELALHRDRTPAAYREALSHIADRVAELVELTTDLTLLGMQGQTASGPSSHASLTVSLDRLAERFGPPATTGVTIGTDVPDVSVLGDQQVLTRGLTLLLEHAIQHRQPDGSVRLRLAPPDGAAADVVNLVLDTSPPRFPGRTWRHLETDAEDTVNTSGLFRLRTAARLLQLCGVALRVHSSEESDAVHLQLRPAPTQTGGLR